MTTRRKSGLRCRVTAIFVVILIAGVLAACGGAQAGPLAPVSAQQPGSVQEPAALLQGTPAVPGAETSSPEQSALPQAGKATGTALPAQAITSEAGGVTVEVTPAGATGEQLLFNLSLNTHSVDLDYDYRALATLGDDQGHTYAAASWKGGSGGHHLQGILAFDAAALQPGAKWVQLDLKGIANVPDRTFRWNLQ